MEYYTEDPSKIDPGYVPIFRAHNISGKIGKKLPTKIQVTPEGTHYTTANIKYNCQ